MNEKSFWEKVAENWVTESDGIEVPDVGIIPDIEMADEEDVMEELDDILADLDLDF